MSTLSSLFQYIHSAQNDNYFFAIFLATIIITRVSLLPKKRFISPKVMGAHVHHYVYGLLLITVAFLFSSIIFYAVGLGLFVDEVPLFGTEKWLFSEEDWHWGIYHSPRSLIILLFGIFLLYMFRENVLNLMPNSVLL